MLIISNLKTKALNAKDLWGNYGWKKFLGEILPWHFFRHYVFYSQELSTQVWDSSSSPAVENFHMEQVGEDNCSHIMAVRPGFYTREILMKRFQEEHICFLGWLEDKPVHLRWNFVGSIYLPYLGRTLCLAPGEIWADEGYTSPLYRGRGIYDYASRHVRSSLYAQGFKRISNTFASWQHSLQMQSQYLGMERIGEAKYLNLFGFKKYFWQGGVVDCGDQTIILNPSHNTFTNSSEV